MLRANTALLSAYPCEEFGSAGQMVILHLYGWLRFGSSDEYPGSVESGLLISPGSFSALLHVIRVDPVYTRTLGVKRY